MREILMFKNKDEITFFFRHDIIFQSYSFNLIYIIGITPGSRNVNGNIGRSRWDSKEWFIYDEHTFKNIYDVINISINKYNSSVTGYFRTPIKNGLLIMSQ